MLSRGKNKPFSIPRGVSCEQHRIWNAASIIYNNRPHKKTALLELIYSLGCMYWQTVCMQNKMEHRQGTTVLIIN
jgi:hypothetical protein